MNNRSCDKCQKYIAKQYIACPKCGNQLQCDIQKLIDEASKTSAGDGMNHPIDFAHTNNKVDRNTACMCNNSHNISNIMSDVPINNDVKRYPTNINYAAKHQQIWKLVQDKINRIIGGNCIMATICDGYSITKSTINILDQIHKFRPDIKLLTLTVMYRRIHNDINYCGRIVLFFSIAEVEKFIPLLVGDQWIPLHDPIQFISYIQYNDGIFAGNRLFTPNITWVYPLSLYLETFEDILTQDSLKTLLLIRQ